MENIKSNKSKISAKTIIGSSVNTHQEVVQYCFDGTGLFVDFFNNTIDRIQRTEIESQTNIAQTTNQQKHAEARIINVDLPQINVNNGQISCKRDSKTKIPVIISMPFRATRIKLSDLTPEEQELYQKAEQLNKNCNTRCGDSCSRTTTPSQHNIEVKSNMCSKICQII